MGNDDRRAPLARRNLLRGLGLAAGGAAGAAVVPVLGAEPEPVETAQEQSKGRYRESDEVRRFYALNRL